MDDIQRAIPHRPPFLLIDRVVSVDKTRIVAERLVRQDDELFSRVFTGHYPGNPIVPGVLLCEMVFQAGAVLLAQGGEVGSNNVPVLVKIRDARFKQTVHPGDLLEIEASLVEQVSNAFHLKGEARRGGKRVLRVEFTCALVSEDATAGDGS